VSSANCDHQSLKYAYGRVRVMHSKPMHIASEDIRQSVTQSNWFLIMTLLWSLHTTLTLHYCTQSYF